MTELEKVSVLNDLEHIIDYNVRKTFNYRLKEYDDIMQDARMLIYQLLDKYDETKGSLSTFCQTIIKTKLVQIVQAKYSNWDKINIDSEYVDICADNSENEINILFNKLNTLVESNKDMFTQREINFLNLFLARKTYKEIDEILGITTNYRLQLVAYLKKKLTKLVEKEGLN